MSLFKDTYSTPDYKLISFHKKNNIYNHTGWGILKYYDIYGKTATDTLMSMTPTYYGTDIPKNEACVKSMQAAMSPTQVSVGIGSMPAPGYNSSAEWHYDWPQTRLQGCCQKLVFTQKIWLF